MSDTVSFWQGPFGRDYHARNRVDWQARMPFWESALEYTGAQSVLELGCGPGWNLLAIQSLQSSIDTYGVDVNSDAVNEARGRGLEVQLSDAIGARSLFDRDGTDLVFTAGLLIHVEPAAIEAVMRTAIDLSAKYVLAIEYAADETTEIEYRGHTGKLWKRPFGKMYEALGLRLLSEGIAGGWEECTYWLLDKGDS